MPHIDYFGYTFKGLQVDESIFFNDYIFLIRTVLPDSIADHLISKNIEYVVQKYGRYGYKLVLYYPNMGISIFSNGFNIDLGIHVVLSGTALKLFNADRDFFYNFDKSIESRCKALEQHFYNNVFGCPKVDFKVSRFDVAYDFDIEFSEFYDKFKSDCFLTKSKSCTTQLDSKNRGTIYVGSRNSACFIRIYDKTLEQQQKQLKLFGGFPFDIPDRWTRLEFELKNDSKRLVAYQAFKAYISSDYDIGCFVINFLRITDTPGYKRTYDDAILWDKFQAVVLQKPYFVQLEVEYKDDFYSTSLNLVYMQSICNYLVTACRSIPGLSDFLIRSFQWSENASNRSKNYYLDFDKLKPISEKPRSDDICLSDEDVQSIVNSWLSNSNI